MLKKGGVLFKPSLAPLASVGGGVINEGLGQETNPFHLSA